MMYILLALLNGVLIALARNLNGRLSMSRGAFFSSWVNHLGGFLFLTLMVLFAQGLQAPFTDIPWYAFLGGAIGALYVGLNSFVVPRLGVTLSTLLVIAGQLLVSVLIDVWFGKILLTFDGKTLQLILGGVLLVIGFYASVQQAQKPTDASDQ